MQETYPLCSLDVIGYAREMPVEGPPPHRLDPVYKVRGEDAVLLPPLRIETAVVMNATRVNLKRFNQDCAAGKWASIQPVQAREAHELWETAERSINYRPSWLVPTV